MINTNSPAKPTNRLHLGKTARGSHRGVRTFSRVCLVAVAIFVARWLGKELQQIYIDRDLVRAVVARDVRAAESAVNRGASANADMSGASLNDRRAFFYLVIRQIIHQPVQKRDLTSVLMYDLEHAGDKNPVHGTKDAADIAAALISHGADPNCSNSHGESAFRYAAKFNLTLVERMLIEHGLNCNMSGRDGVTPLMMARSAVIEELLLRHGANIDSVDEQGQTALSYAAMEVDLVRIRLLLSRGADPLHRDSGGANLLLDLAVGMFKLLDFHWQWDNSSPGTAKLNSDAINIAAILMKAGVNPSPKEFGKSLEDDLRVDGLHVDYRAAAFIRYIHGREHVNTGRHHHARTMPT